jgi:outer membrane receptor protein involved in Fe transport
VLSVALSLWALLLAPAPQPAAVRGTVVDAAGAAIGGARIRATPASQETTSAPDGTFVLEGVALPVVLVVSAPGFTEATVTIDSGVPQRVLLQPRGIVESVTVTASAGERRITTPGSATVLDADALAALPAFGLDDQLRSVPGFSLFRRSSSRVTNPTAQGVTLRGLSGSGASRTLVVADGVPLNDPFGGWVYWDRIPAASIDRVEVARGGASDLHGSDAMGGAIRIETADAGARLVAEGGQDGTARVSAFGGRAWGRWGASGAFERSTTDGYITVARESRGSIDVPATSRASTGYARAGASAGTVSVDVRAAYFTERRGNGTPFQTNATVARQASVSARGQIADGGWDGRVFHLSQDYDQTFSAVLAGRAAERPSSAQHVDSTSGGGAFEWARPIGAGAVFVSATARQVAAALTDQSLPLTGPPAAALRARQRSGALVVHSSFIPAPRVTVSGGVRSEFWRSKPLDTAGEQTAAFLAPRAAVTFRATDRWSMRAALQSGYRTPTINELYRDFRVGNVLTRANAALEPERSLGVEGSALLTVRRLTARATAFWTRLDDAIVNVTIAPAANPILRQRQNAGRIRAAGAEFESDLRLSRILAVTASAAVIDSVFTEGVDLDGLRVPQVPRLHASGGLRATWAAVAVSADWRYISRQFDDDRNQLALEPSTAVDGRLAWRVRRGVELFAAVENAFDEEQDVGRTPLRTIGLPRTFRTGVRLGLQ